MTFSKNRALKLAAFALITVALLTPAFAEGIFDAVVSGDIIAVDKAISAGADPSSKEPRDGLTPLHFAAIRNFTDIARLLLYKGAAADVRSLHNETPLHLASVFGSTDVAKLLIGQKADVNARDDKGNTPLACAAITGQTEVAKLLLVDNADAGARSKSGETPMHKAARNSNLDIIKLLITAKADVKATDENGNTPLHMIAGCGTVDPKRANITGKRAKIVTKPEWGSKLMFCADNPTIAELLISNGADPRAKNKMGQTPLKIAQEAKQLDMIEFFKSKGIKE